MSSFVLTATIQRSCNASVAESAKFRAASHFVLKPQSEEAYGHHEEFVFSCLDHPGPAYFERRTEVQGAGKENQLSADSAFGNAKSCIGDEGFLRDGLPKSLARAFSIH